MKNEVLKIIENASLGAEDNYIRAKMQFKSYSKTEMLENYGQSGETCQSIFDGYEKRYKEIRKCYEWVIDNC